MPRHDPVRIAETLEQIASGTVQFRITRGHERTISAGILRAALGVIRRQTAALEAIGETLANDSTPHVANAADMARKAAAPWEKEDEE